MAPLLGILGAQSATAMRLSSSRSNLCFEMGPRVSLGSELQIVAGPLGFVALMFQQDEVVSPRVAVFHEGGDTEAHFPNPPPSLAAVTRGGVQGRGARPAMPGGGGSTQHPFSFGTRAAASFRESGAGVRMGVWSVFSFVFVRICHQVIPHMGSSPHGSLQQKKFPKPLEPIMTVWRWRGLFGRRTETPLCGSTPCSPLRGGEWPLRPLHKVGRWAPPPAKG